MYLNSKNTPFYNDNKGFPVNVFAIHFLNYFLQKF